MHTPDGERIWGDALEEYENDVDGPYLCYEYVFLSQIIVCRPHRACPQYPLTSSRGCLRRAAEEGVLLRLRPPPLVRVFLSSDVACRSQGNTTAATTPSQITSFLPTTKQNPIAMVQHMMSPTRTNNLQASTRPCGRHLKHPPTLLPAFTALRTLALELRTATWSLEAAFQRALSRTARTTPSIRSKTQTPTAQRTPDTRSTRRRPWPPHPGALENNTREIVASVLCLA